MAGEHELQRLAARQHGLASRRQILALGYSSRQISRRSTAGRWVRAAPGVYDVAPGSIDPRRPLHAAVLASRGWASHRSAAALLGLVDSSPSLPEVVVAEGRLPEGLDALVHRSRMLAARERTTIDGIACTAAARTLLDLADVVDASTLDAAVGRALQLGRTTVRRLQRYAGQSLGGRRGVTPLRLALERYGDRAKATQSLLEVIVERAVLGGALPAPCRQLVVRTAGQEFHLDLAWPAALVFVEADGFAFHSSRAQFLRDRERQNLLVVAGWLPLRYTWPVATGQPGLIVEQLRAVLPRRLRRR